MPTDNDYKILEVYEKTILEGKPRAKPFGTAKREAAAKKSANAGQVRKMANKADDAFNAAIRKAEMVFISSIYAALDKAEDEGDFDTLDTIVTDRMLDGLSSKQINKLVRDIHTKWKKSGTMY